jgi:hypothetical protein
MNEELFIRILKDSKMAYYPGAQDRILWNAPIKECLELLMKNVAMDVYTNLLHPEIGSFWSSEECNALRNAIIEDMALCCEDYGAARDGQNAGKEFSSHLRSFKKSFEV